MTTPHHFTYLSNSEEIQILHKSVDLAEKDFDRGRIQVKDINENFWNKISLIKNIQARIRLKSGRVIQLVLSTEMEVDAVVHSIQLLSMIGTGSEYETTRSPIRYYKTSLCILKEFPFHFFFI